MLSSAWTRRLTLAFDVSRHRATLRGWVLIPALGGCLGCAASIGMYGHRPELLWSTPVTAALGPPEKVSYAGPSIVLKRFENRSRVPVGAHFVAENPKKTSSKKSGELASGQSDWAKQQKSGLAHDAMSQAYVPESDLAVPIFEAALSRLQEAGLPVWKDYMASQVVLRGPPTSDPFVVVVGELQELELDTFATDSLYEAARVVVAFRALGHDAKEARRWTVEIVAKTRRGERDILELAGQLLADAMREQLVQIRSKDSAASIGPELGFRPGGGERMS